MVNVICLLLIDILNKKSTINNWLFIIIIIIDHWSVLPDFQPDASSD